jgi:hypothetical protein
VLRCDVRPTGYRRTWKWRSSDLKVAGSQLNPQAFSGSGLTTLGARITGGQLSALPVKLPVPEAAPEVRVPGAPAPDEPRPEDLRRRADRAIQITAIVEAAAVSLPADEVGTLGTDKG